jgi:hypothetical protein
LLRAFLAVLVAVAPLVLAGTPAEASVPPGYQITVSESAPTMAYSEPSPLFRASLTVPAGDPGPSVQTDNFYLLVDSRRYFTSISGGGPTFTFAVRLDGAPLPAGQHSVFAQYASPTAGLVTSAPITLTVLKTTPVLACGVANSAATYLPGTPLTIDTQFSSISGATTPVDPTQGTFAVTFAGTQTFTVSGLMEVAPVPDGSGQFVVPAPQVPDVYQATCSFSGTANVNPVETRMSIPTVIVSRNHAIGGIQVHTDPTPVRDGVTITWNVVVLGAPGLPAPTGLISIRLGGQFTSIIALTSGGSVTFQTNPATGLTIAGSIRVNYDGDPWYAASSADFPLTGSPPAPQSAPSPAAAGPVSLSAIAPPVTGQGPASSAAPASGTKAATATLTATRALVASGALGMLIALVAGLSLWRRRRSAGTP